MNQTYKAPVSGFYTCKREMYRSFPTGKKIMIKNTSLKWFQFWKPKMVEVDEYETKKIQELSETNYFKVGDVIGFSVSISRNTSERDVCSNLSRKE